MLKATFTIFTIGFFSLGTLAFAAETAQTGNNGNTAAQIVAQAQAAAAQDGQNKRSGASQALDAAALASKALCSTLTLAAMAEKDPQKKQEKKDMAMLACMQAAANQKAGDENKDSANALNGLTPQFGGYQSPTMKETTASNDDESPLYSEAPSSGSSQNPYDGMIDIPEITVPDLSGGGKKDGTLTANAGGDGKGAVAPGEGFTALSPIDPAGLTYELGEEAAKNAAGGIGTVNASAKPAELPATQASPSNQVATIGAPPSMRGLAKEAGAGGEDAAATAGGGDGAFDTLMAQLMGGPPADGMMNSAFGGGFSDIRFMTNNPATGPRINIFQFASQNYQQANSQTRVLTRSQRSRQLASVKP